LRPSTPPPDNTADSKADGPRGSARIFYGWWIVGASALASTLQTAFFNAGSSAIFLPVAREFDTTRTAIAGAFAFSRLEGALTGPVEGYLIHWIGPRRYMMVGWVIFGLGLIAVGLSRSLFQFYAAFLLVTLGQSVAGFLAIVTVLINWFQRYRGRAIAIFQLGSSLGALLVPIFAWFVLNTGWRETMMAAGVISMAIGVPLASVMRGHPEDFGYVQDSIAAQGTAQDPSAPLLAAEPNISVGRALRSRGFWFLGITHSVSLVGWGALRVHMIPAIVDMGFTEQTAANILALSLVVASVGRLIGGFLGDIIGTRRVLVVSILIQALALVIFAFASTLTHIMIFSVVCGVAFGARGVLMTVMRGEVFGRTNFSRLAGLMDPLSTVGVVASPIFAALMYDSTGSYRTAFLVIAAIGALGALLLFGIPKPSSFEEANAHN